MLPLGLYKLERLMCNTKILCKFKKDEKYSVVGSQCRYSIYNTKDTFSKGRKYTY